MADVTEKQLQVLSFIKSYSSSSRYSPTVRDMVKGLGKKSTFSITAHLNKLEEKGLITRQPLVARSTLLTEEGEKALSKK